MGPPPPPSLQQTEAAPRAFPTPALRPPLPLASLDAQTPRTRTPHPPRPDLRLAPSDRRGARAGARWRGSGPEWAVRRLRARPEARPTLQSFLRGSRRREYRPPSQWARSSAPAPPPGRATDASSGSRAPADSRSSSLAPKARRGRSPRAEERVKFRKGA